MSKPNILFITVDTLRADRLGSYGRTPSITPTLDRLASTGVQFDQAITGGSWTQAAFPTIFTSTYASMYGGCLGALSKQRPSPVAALAQHGYRTAGFSSAPWVSATYGYDRGFDFFSDLDVHEEDPTLRRLSGGQRLLRSTQFQRIARLTGSNLRPARVYASARETNHAALAWLSQADAPFFMWLHYMDVHWPYHVEDTLTEAADIAQAWRDLSEMHEYNHQHSPLPDELRRRFADLYDQALKYLDDALDALLSGLAAGLADDTIVVLAADHGEEFFERGKWGHVETNLYDEVARVPLVFGGPRLRRGANVPQQVSTLDIMPTILDLCQCPPPPGLLGRSLVPALIETDRTLADIPAVTERWRTESHIISVRTLDYKYIWNSDAAVPPVLFALQTDPEEAHNVYEQFPDVAAILHQKVEEVLALSHETADAGDGDDDVELSDVMIKRLHALGYVDV